LLLGGMLFLWGSAELLVKGSSELAIGFGIRPMLVGLTIVAMGTSSPELAVSLYAALTATKDISLGNIIGSNIANIGLVVSICAMIKKLHIEKSAFRREIPIMVGGTLLFCLLAWNGVLSFWDGLILLACFFAFMMFTIKQSRGDRNRAKAQEGFVDIRKDTKAVLKNLLYIFVGLVGLILASYLIVNSAKYIANYFGISTFVIGISLVAIGTSLPELAISVVGVVRGEVELAIGNAIGSNIFNTLFVIATVAVVTPIPVDRSLFQLHIPFMVGFTIVMIPMMRTKSMINRVEGLILFLAYAVFIFFIFTNP